jgi:hypothetical protein
LALWSGFKTYSKMTIPLIWSSLKEDANQPICSEEEAIMIKNGKNTNSNLSLKTLNPDYENGTVNIFNFIAPQTLLTVEDAQIIITKDTEVAVKDFIESERLSEISESVFFIISTINTHVSAIIDYKKATKVDFGNDVKNYGNDLADLNKLIELYYGNHFDIPTVNNNPLLSISFKFQNKTISIKNHLLLLSIMNNIRDGNKIDPSISSNWATKETWFKQHAAENIFKFLNSDRPWGMADKSEIYVQEVIAKIFNLSDIEANYEVIRMWRRRSKD